MRHGERELGSWALRCLTYYGNMRVLALTTSMDLSQVLAGSVLCFREEAALAAAHRAEPASVVIVERSSFPRLDVASLSRPRPPSVLFVVEHEADVDRALAEGADDWEIATTPARLAARVRVMHAARLRRQQLQSDADALALMTSHHEGGWRLWEFDLHANAFIRMLPEGPSARHHAHDSVAARSWTTMYCPAEQARIKGIVREELAHFARTGEVRRRSFDVAITNADGTRGFRSTMTTLVLDDDGKPRVWRGISVDTTEAVQTRSALASAEETFRACLEAIPAPVVTVDRAGHVVGWNPAAQATFGWTPEEVLGRPYPVVDGRDGSRQEPQRLLAETFAGRTVSGYETTRLKKDGSPVELSIWARAVPGPDGEALHSVAVMTDVTARNLAAMDYKRLFDAADDAIVVVDAGHGTIRDVNARACQAWDRPRDALTGQRLDDVSPALARSLQAVHPELDRLGAVRFELTEDAAPRARVHWEAHASRIDYGGRPAILCVNRDVTSRRDQEDALRKRDQALGEARRLEALGRLAGGVAHDFNNSLMVIESCSEVLAQTLEEGELADEVSDLTASVTRAKTLVKQLLVFARCAPVQVETLDLVEVLPPLLAMLRRILGEHVELVTNLTPSRAYVRADPAQVEQIVANLIVNARDALASAGSRRGRGRIEVVGRLSARPDMFELSVRDDGPGMDEATRARIFEPFFTTKEAGAGTGLGLATVHGIVLGLGGEIAVTSELGAGTEFRVTLPTVDQQPADRSPTSRRRTKGDGSGSILLVEDERGVRRALARELKRSGYDVLESEDGAAALDLAAGHPDPIDMLVTDVVMPRMGGLELASRLRASRPGIQVVFMTGYRPPDAVEHDGAAGAEILTKPFPPAQLMEVVRSVLQRRAP